MSEMRKSEKDVAGEKFKWGNTVYDYILHTQHKYNTSTSTSYTIYYNMLYKLTSVAAGLEVGSVHVDAVAHGVGHVVVRHIGVAVSVVLVRSVGDNRAQVIRIMNKTVLTNDHLCTKQKYFETLLAC